MGACASAEKGEEGGSDTKFSFFKFRAKADRAIVIPEPPLKETKPVAVDFLVKSFDDFGSKNETFFDSKAWLDSDCDDDFFSVNGDFTPSRGNTPVHHKFSTGAPQVLNASAADKVFGYAAQASLTGKKRLSELFRESIREKHGVDEPQAQASLASGSAAAKQTILDVLPRSPQATLGNERTTDLDLVERDVSMNMGQCCLPSLMPSRSLTDRKKRTVTVAGKA